MQSRFHFPAHELGNLGNRIQFRDSGNQLAQNFFLIVSLSKELTIQPAPQLDAIPESQAEKSQQNQMQVHGVLKEKLRDSAIRIPQHGNNQPDHRQQQHE